MLKWQLQPEHQNRSWRSTILNQRHEIATLLDQMPSLHRLLEDAVPTAYRRALELAAAETGFPRSRFAKECSFLPEESPRLALLDEAGDLSTGLHGMPVNPARLQ